MKTLILINLLKFKNSKQNNNGQKHHFNQSRN